MKDEALDWLMANDPEFRGQRQYTRDFGILTPSVETDIRTHECEYPTEGRSIHWHCRYCQQDAKVNYERSYR